jgi:hypothetical protein
MLTIQRTTHVDTYIGKADAKQGDAFNSAVSRLNAWQQRGEQGEQRDVAVQNILRCWEYGEAALNLSGLGLQMQPPVLPPQVVTINFSGNNLTRFSLALPLGAKSLDLSHNKMQKFSSPLPETMHSLNLSHNAMSKLDAKMNNSLAELNLENNHFHQAPENLPSKLKILNLRINSLGQFPRDLPPFLDGVDVRGNNNITELTTLPHHTLINIDGHKLDAQSRTILAQYRDDFKAYIGISDIEFEHGAPVIDVAEEPVIPAQPIPRPRVRPAVTPTASVTATAIPAQPTTRAAVTPTAHDRREMAGRLSAVLAQLGAAEEIAPPLAHSVAAWYPEERRPALIRAWEKIEEQAAVKAEPVACSNFLTKLNANVNKDLGGFKEAVVALLDQALASPPLRDAIFNIAIEGTTSCQDRVSVSFQEMQKAALAERALKGEFNGSLRKLIQLGRQAYRDEKLQQAANGIVKTKLNEKLEYAENPAVRQHYYAGMADDEIKEEILTTIDPVGVYLLLRLQALDQLSVNSSVKRMRFPATAIVTPEKVAAAVLSIQAAEDTEFSEWLSTWTPWGNALSNVYEAEYDKAMDKLTEQYSDPALLKKKVDAAISAKSSITSDSLYYDQMYRDTGLEVMQTMKNEIMHPLTQKFLKSKGMSAAVAPVWHVAGSRPDSKAVDSARNNATGRSNFRTPAPIRSVAVSRPATSTVAPVRNVTVTRSDTSTLAPARRVGTRQYTSRASAPVRNLASRRVV